MSIDKNEETEEINSDSTLSTTKLKKKAGGQIRGGIWFGILLLFVSIAIALANHRYLYFISSGIFILYILSAYKRWFCVNLILWAFISCGFAKICIMQFFSNSAPFLRFVYVFLCVAFCYVLLGPVLGMSNEKKATQD